MRRALAAALLAALAAVTAAGCSSSDGDAATTTTEAATTTTTKPEITDEEIVANINEQVSPVLEGEYEPDTVDCIIGVLEDGGTGRLDADAVVPAYDERCGVSATAVTGVLTASVLVDRGATEKSAACVKDRIASQTYEEIEELDEDSTNALYESCGIDVASLGGS